MDGMRPQLGTWAAGLRVARYRWRRFVGAGSLWALTAIVPLFVGLILKIVFDRVSASEPAYRSALSWLAVLVAVELGRGLVVWAAFAYWPAWWQGVSALLRGSMLWSLVCAPGPPSERMPASSGEALGRFRDDVDDVTMFVDVWVDVAGAMVMALAAIAVMGAINWPATAAVVGSLIAVLVANRWLGSIVERTHRRMRERGSSVTDLVADLFAGILTLKTSGSEDRALRRFTERNAVRRQAAVRAQLAIDLMNSIGGAGVGLSVGLVLLLVSGAMRDGTFSVGDLALFTALASSLSAPPRWIGRMLARRRSAGVALHRTARLMPNRRVEELLTARPAPAAGDGHGAEPLRELRLVGLAARHATTGAGIQGVDLTVRASQFTAITGEAGSGKTTLLRALLGMLPLQSGEILWNGRPVTDPSTELVPPRSAYAGQLPRLFSSSLEENVALGWPADERSLRHALALARFTPEEQSPPLDFDTRIGPRGSRLSGGQAQRAALARALVRKPELLVLDDASSALDHATERHLWRALRGSGTTCLVASHRRAVLELADHIVVLQAGRVVASGSLPALLVESPEFQRLWRAELQKKDALED